SAIVLKIRRVAIQSHYKTPDFVVRYAILSYKVWKIVRAD
ncbi:hypothetical protein HMPREF1586_01093, partial [Gardnerella vaginalis JCP8522]